VAARLAEDSRFRILLLEAGRDSADIDTVKMTGGWAQNFGGEDDWNIISEPSKGLNGRRIYNSRGRFLGGSSCVNGTLCIRGKDQVLYSISYDTHHLLGPRQDYDNWELEGWSGEEVYKYMAKVCAKVL
jgi:choline dehydrogenase-like flavoprotein